MALQLQDGTDLLLQDGTPLELQAGGLPLAITDPVNWSGYSGQLAQFFAYPSGGTGPYTLQWYETTAGLLAGETNTYLNITTALADDGKSYYCIATDALLDTVQSATATLSVTAEPVEVVLDTFIRTEDGTWSSIQGSATGDIIDDTIVSLLKTWSSQKITDELGLKLSLSDYDPDKNKWRGEWGDGEYHKFDQVEDQGWLMIANTTTTDRAAPQPQGEPFFLYSGTPTTDSNLASQVIMGGRYSPQVSTQLITGMRIYTAIGNNYRVFTVENPGPQQIITEVYNFEAANAGWQDLNLSGGFISVGQTLDLVVFISEPDPTPTTFTGDWNYQTPQNPAVPIAGQIQHSRSQPSVMEISTTDSNAGDRYAELAGLDVGDVIDDQIVRWSIQSITDNTTYFTFGVSPATNSAIGTKEFTFETVTPTPISYIRDDDYWLSDVAVSGLFGADTDYSAIVPDDNQYGVDIQVQNYSASPDWDFQALTSSGSGGGASSDSGGIARITRDLQYAPVENGFTDRSASTISFDDVTRTFTISPNGLAYVFFHERTPYIILSDRTVVIPDVEGLYYIYFDGDTLVQTDTFVESLITDFAFVAVVYWDATNSAALFVGEERHGNVMDSTTHTYNHLTLGARYQSGLGLLNMDVDGNGNDASAAQFDVDSGFIWDEDIQHHIVDGVPQELSVAEIPMFYRTGATGLWRKTTATQYPITTTGSGRPAWNEWTGATWQLTEVAANDFVLTHYYATNDINHPIVGIVGQADYAMLAGAQAAAESEINSLAYGPLGTLTPEFVPIATVIWETRTSYGNAVKARVRSTDDGRDFIDWRFRRGGVAASV